jgi:hypothetical protein
LQAGFGIDNPVTEVVTLAARRAAGARRGAEPHQCAGIVAHPELTRTASAATISRFVKSWNI